MHDSDRAAAREAKAWHPAPDGGAIIPRDGRGLTLAARYRADGPAVGDDLRVLDGPERGIRVTVVDVDGWDVTVSTAHGRTLTFDPQQLAPIAPRTLAR